MIGVPAGGVIWKAFTLGISGDHRLYCALSDDCGSNLSLAGAAYVRGIKPPSVVTRLKSAAPDSYLMKLSPAVVTRYGLKAIVPSAARNLVKEAKDA
jgi:hypothetical protein